MALLVAQTALPAETLPTAFAAPLRVHVGIGARRNVGVCRCVPDSGLAHKAGMSHEEKEVDKTIDLVMSLDSGAEMPADENEDSVVEARLLATRKGFEEEREKKTEEKKDLYLQVFRMLSSRLARPSSSAHIIVATLLRLLAYFASLSRTCHVITPFLFTSPRTFAAVSDISYVYDLTHGNSTSRLMVISSARQHTTISHGFRPTWNRRFECVCLWWALCKVSLSNPVRTCVYIYMCTSNPAFCVIHVLEFRQFSVPRAKYIFNWRIFRLHINSQPSRALLNRSHGAIATTILVRRTMKLEGCGKTAMSRSRRAKIALRFSRQCLKPLCRRRRTAKQTC